MYMYIVYVHIAGVSVCIPVLPYKYKLCTAVVRSSNDVHRLTSSSPPPSLPLPSLPPSLPPFLPSLLPSLLSLPNVAFLPSLSLPTLLAPPFLLSSLLPSYSSCSSLPFLPLPLPLSPFHLSLPSFFPSFSLPSYSPRSLPLPHPLPSSPLLPSSLPRWLREHSTSGTTSTW